MRVLIDTNRYRDFCEGDPIAVEVFRSAYEIHIPLIVVAELRAGFAVGTRSRKNEETLRRFLHRGRVVVTVPDLDTTHHYAQLFRQLRSQGTPIPTNDIWIAALAIQNELVLFTRDEHFEHLPQLPRI